MSDDCCFGSDEETSESESSVVGMYLLPQPAEGADEPVVPELGGAVQLGPPDGGVRFPKSCGGAT